eukprot:Gregarina_sp_Poly_1__6567@NODE_351_length_9317_cov_65_080541_g294_i0_p6_GENE_NODE_351_length_9317_cov_65_080541_g294_i0NODE_351_length_9317_cov_65_080541_g294_i0_p6_ORF_typecomplete_len177_score25_81_NODE_351_length_9317_cov_65_080541_g294_i058736403
MAAAAGNIRAKYLNRLQRDESPPQLANMAQSVPSSSREPLQGQENSAIDSDPSVAQSSFKVTVSLPLSQSTTNSFANPFYDHSMMLETNEFVNAPSRYDQLLNILTSATSKKNPYKLRSVLTQARPDEELLMVRGPPLAATQKLQGQSFRAWQGEGRVQKGQGPRNVYKQFNNGSY